MELDINVPLAYFLSGKGALLVLWIRHPFIEGDLSMRVKIGVLMAFFGLLGATPIFAHHGFNVEFDGTKCMDLKGTLSDITWENPHAYLQMDVKDADGKVAVWHLEMITPNALKRNGTTRQDFVANMGKPMNARACPVRVIRQSRFAQMRLQSVKKPQMA